MEASDVAEEELKLLRSSDDLLGGEHSDDDSFQSTYGITYPEIVVRVRQQVAAYDRLAAIHLKKLMELSVLIGVESARLKLIYSFVEVVEKMFLNTASSMLLKSALQAYYERIADLLSKNKTLAHTNIFDNEETRNILSAWLLKRVNFTGVVAMSTDELEQYTFGRLPRIGLIKLLTIFHSPEILSFLDFCHSVMISPEGCQVGMENEETCIQYFTSLSRIITLMKEVL